MLYEFKNEYKSSSPFVPTVIEVSTASELDSKVLEELKIKDPEEGDDDNKDKS